MLSSHSVATGGVTVATNTRTEYHGTDTVFILHSTLNVSTGYRQPSSSVSYAVTPSSTHKSIIQNTNTQNKELECCLWRQSETLSSTHIWRNNTEHQLILAKNLNSNSSLSLKLNSNTHGQVKWTVRALQIFPPDILIECVALTEPWTTPYILSRISTQKHLSTGYCNALLAAIHCTCSGSGHLPGLKKRPNKTQNHECAPAAPATSSRYCAT